jgi:O-antigen ligase
VQRIAQFQFERLNTVPLTDRILGTAFLIVVAVSIVGTRATAVLVPLLAVLVVLLALYERTPLKTFLRVPRTTAAFGVLLAYAVLSTAWAVSPLESLPHVVAATLMLLSVHGLSVWIGEQEEPRLRHLMFWIIVAFAAGLLWLTLDVVGHQSIKQWFINAFEFLKPHSTDKHYRFDHTGYVWLTLSDLNRNIAALNLLLWPVLMCAAVFWSGTKGRVIIGVLFAATVVCTFASEHETSKLAIIAAALIYVVARLSIRVAKGLLLAGWAVVILATVPIALYAYNGLGLQNSEWVQRSGRDRIVIWADIAERTLENPILGVGARSTNALNARGTASLTESNERKQWTIGRHPHNVYLQAWYELGAIGAILLGIAGLVAFSQLSQFAPQTWPFALATLTSTALELALCWDIWQRWFFGIVCFSAVVLVMALRWVSLQQPAALQRASG